MTGPLVTPARHDAGYSPRHRTAVVLTGTGTAGAYQAGVLKALTEAGVRFDLVAGHGIGIAGALFAAIDGGTRLWAPDGAWRLRDVARFYTWRPAIRALGWALGAALAVVVVPLIGVAAGALVYLAAFLLGLAGLPSASTVADRYTALVHDAFLPDRLPTWVPQIALLLLTAVLLLLLSASWRGRLRGRFREHGRFWWRVLGAPVGSHDVMAFWRGQLWRLLAGGARAAAPDPGELSRRYAELLSDNLGQPGFREVIAVVHDLDSRQDLTFAALAEPWRRAFFGRGPGSGGWTHRAGETFDLAGVDRDHVADVLAASQSLPVATPPWPVTFAPESLWRGETHRLCDRPGCVARVLDEVLAAGAEQVILVSAASSAGAPHALAAPRIDGFGKLGEWLASQEASAVRDAVRARQASFRSLHVISPAHNAAGPLDFTGSYDERSDRVQTLEELIARGYEDAYRAFVEPVVGAAEDPVPGAGGRPTR